MPTRKVNRWSLELAMYNITFEWISWAHNKAADCLSWLVDVKDTPVTSNASINMVVTSTPDGPATHTHSKTLAPTDTTPPADVQSMVTSNTGIVNTPPPLLENHKDTPRLMQRLIPPSNAFQNGHLMAKHLPIKLTLSLTLKVFSTKMLWIQNKKFLSLIIPKSWCFTVFVEAHDKLDHQGINRTYHIIKQQYYWKGMNKDICKYVTNCAQCKTEKNKIAIELVRDLNIGKSTHSDYHWPFITMARGFSNSQQESRHHCSCFDQ